jgi:hypothetical protein
MFRGIFADDALISAAPSANDQQTLTKRILVGIPKQEDQVKERNVDVAIIGSGSAG